MERWKKGRFKRTIKELSQLDNKKPEKLESEFDHFYVDNSYPTSPFKGRNIVDLDFVYRQLLDGHKACKTTLSLTQYQRERLIGLKAGSQDPSFGSVFSLALFQLTEMLICVSNFFKFDYNIPRACLLNRSPVPGMDLKSNRSGL